MHWHSLPAFCQYTYLSHKSAGCGLSCVKEVKHTESGRDVMLALQASWIVLMLKRDFSLHLSGLGFWVALHDIYINKTIAAVNFANQ
jgi:hypothetical protein